MTSFEKCTKSTLYETHWFMTATKYEGIGKTCGESCHSWMNENKWNRDNSDKD